MSCRKKQNKISRRDFCRSVPCAAFGVAASPGLFGIASGKDTTKQFPGKSRINSEDKLAKKITAVNAKVISQKGSCAMGHKVGDTVKFTESGVEGKICIHALYSLMPKVFAFMHEARFSWLEDPDVSTHACPDAYNPVVFEITRVWEE